MTQGYLLQMLSAKLGVVTGRNLAQQCRRAWDLHSPVHSCACYPESQPIMLWMKVLAGFSIRMLQGTNRMYRACNLYLFMVYRSAEALRMLGGLPSKPILREGVVKPANPAAGRSTLLYRGSPCGS